MVRDIPIVAAGFVANGSPPLLCFFEALLARRLAAERWVHHLLHASAWYHEYNEDFALICVVVPYLSMGFEYEGSTSSEFYPESSTDFGGCWNAYPWQSGVL